MVQPIMSSRIKRRNFYKSLSLSAGVGVLILFLGFLGFVRAIGNTTPPTHYPTGQFDAVVVVTGATGRLQEGLRLLNADTAPKLFVSGVGLGMDIRRLLKLAKKNPEWLESRIFLGYQARSTAQNAVESQAWIAQHGVKTVLLVTNNYHIMRTHLEFADRMPDVLITRHAISSPRVHVDEWYKYPKTGLLLAEEYIKFLIVWAEKHILP